MEVVYPCCCGLDVHKKSITACVLWAEAKGKSRKEKKRFGTFTHDLLQLADWLAQCGVTHVAVESTGVYWKPVWNILAEQFEVLLVNAQHIKAVPGRKTDQKDSEWIADLPQHGLLRGSFVPPQPIRELRDLTRQRSPNLSAWDRIFAGWMALLVRPTRLLRSGIVLKPSTLLGRLTKSHQVRCVTFSDDWNVRKALGDSLAFALR
jgi:transposase